MKPQTTLRVLQLVFLGIGLAMLVGALFWLVHQRRFVASASHAQGKVVDLARRQSNRSSSGSNHSSSSTWAPVVIFATPDGREHRFVSSTSSNPPAYDRGEQVDVLYQAGTPESGIINGWFSLWGGISIIGGLGLLFVAVGIAVTLVRRSGVKRKRLMKTGRRIEALFQSVQQNHSLSVNGRHPFQVVCQWLDPQTSQLHVFTSENLWYDPSEFINDKRFPVYLQPGDARRYYVDISSLPTTA